MSTPFPFPQPDITSDRLSLRRFRASDAADMFAYTSDDEVTRFLSWNSHLSVDDAVQYIDSMTQAYINGDWPAWGIELVAESKLVGSISLRNYSSLHKQAELSYVMNRAFGGRGIMSEAVDRIVRYCFDELDLERVEARCMTDNFASERVMQKTGMSPEGILRRHQWIKGRFHDFKIYSILREEYLARRS
ncbi:MAG: GNAT family N-acetyltransferase [Calditrichaeota bacterium]|nr:GNAT family N-acetyltransferase [Calditrichota bacterium]MCB9367647.1 GNAT family N-acetyltransferase [Calditrichota bacterium]